MSGWKPENDDLMVTTLKCKSCGATWPVTEDVPDRPERIVKTDTYRCANCDQASVFEIGVSKIERRQG